MKKHPSVRQQRYAYGIMNEAKTKQQVAIESGFSRSTARVPRLIENKLGFQLAIAQLGGKMGGISLQILLELQTRDLKQMDNKTLINSLEIISKTHERFSSMSSKR